MTTTITTTVDGYKIRISYNQSMLEERLSDLEDNQIDELHERGKYFLDEELSDLISVVIEPTKIQADEIQYEATGKLPDMDAMGDDDRRDPDQVQNLLNGWD